MPKKKETEYRKHLVGLTKAVDYFLDVLDAEMKKPSDFERGQRIAKMCNGLNMANDSAKHFALGIKLENCRCLRRSQPAFLHGESTIKINW